MFYVDVLTLISKSLEGLKGILEAWTGTLESKKLRVNVKMKKIIISRDRKKGIFLVYFAENM